MATDRIDAAALELAVGADESGWALPWLRPTVRHVVSQHRGHALLLHSAPGAGALHLAVALAQAWLCESPVDHLPCGACTACHAVRQRLHADLMLLMPEALRRTWHWPLTGDKTDEAGEGANARKKPSRQLRIEEVRQAVDWTATTSARGRGKVLVLHPASALNQHAANALLKTLEEPAAGVRIVLTADDPQHLLPTIRSRCQTVRPRAPEKSTLQAWLRRQGVTDAEPLLDAAIEQPLVALEWSQAGLDAAAWNSMPAAVGQGRAEAFQNWPLGVAIDVLMRICHDALCRAVGGPARFFPRGNWPAAAAGGASITSLNAWHRSLQRAARHAEHPLQEALLLEALVDEGRLALRGAAR